MSENVSQDEAAGKVPDSVQMGWAAPPIKEQFPQLPDAVANRLQMDSDSITHLSLRHILTPAEKKKALFRFAGLVSDALKDARRAPHHSAGRDAP
jgi:hypothetical protein